MTAASPSDPRRPATAQALLERQWLVDAGLEIAERIGLEGLAPEAVAVEAGLPESAFHLHFEDRAAFVDALHRRFYARVGETVGEAVRGVEPGAERLGRTIEAYLDACREGRGARALLIEARGDPGATTMIAERLELFVALAAPSLEASGRPDPTAAARVLAAMASEVAIVELEGGRPVPEARARLQDLVDGGDR